MQQLTSATLLQSYTIKGIDTQEEEMRRFLFSLGCYPGEEITVVSIISDTYVVAIKDGRYSVDKQLASVIMI